MFNILHACPAIWNRLPRITSEPLMYDIAYYTLDWLCNAKSPILQCTVFIAQIIPDSRDPFAFDLNNTQEMKFIKVKIRKILVTFLHD